MTGSSSQHSGDASAHAAAHAEKASFKSDKPSLKKVLSLWDLFIIAFGATIGTSWALLVGTWIMHGGGPLPTMYAFLLVTLILIPVGAAFSELTAAMPVAGGIVEHVHRAFGELPSFICGWFLLLSDAIICPWEAIIISRLLSTQLSQFPIFSWLTSIKLYTILNTDIYLWPVLISVGCCLFVLNRNLRGVIPEARLSSFLSKTLLIGMAIVIISTLSVGSETNALPTFASVPDIASHTPVALSLPHGIVAVLALAPFYYAGFDTITMHAEEAAQGLNWSKFGKVISLAIIATGCFYLVCIYSFGTILPWREFIQHADPAFHALKHFNIHVYTVMLFIVIFGSLGPMNAFLAASARIAYALAKRHQLPTLLAHIDDEGHVPNVAYYLLILLTLIGPFLGHVLLTPLTSIASAGFIFSCLMSSYACLYLRFKEPDLARPYRVPAGKIGITISCINSTLLFIFIALPLVSSSLSALDWLFVLFWTFVGFGLRKLAQNAYYDPLPPDGRGINGR